MLKEKADFDEVTKIWKHFDKFALYDDLKDLYMKTVPEIFMVEGTIEDHRREV